MLRLISTDFDGTIHDPYADPPIPDEFVKWIRAAQEAGSKWVINTGRELQDVVEKMQLLRMDIFPDIIISVERHIHERKGYDYREHTAWNSLCQADHRALFAEAEEPMKRIRDWVGARFEAQFYGDDWSPLCIIATHSSDADHIHQKAEEECRNVPDLCIVRNAVYFRFGHVRYNKGTALAEVARMFGIGKEHIFAAGDHFNDLPMLDRAYADCVAAPSNAIPEVREAILRAGGFQAERPCGLGIVDALSFFQKKLS